MKIKTQFVLLFSTASGINAIVCHKKLPNIESYHSSTHLIVFRPPSRDTYGFESISTCNIQKAEFVSACEAVDPSSNIKIENIESASRSSEIQYIKFDNCYESVVILAAKRCILLHGLYRMIADPIHHINATKLLDLNDFSADESIKVEILGGEEIDKFSFRAVLAKVSELIDPCLFKSQKIIRVIIDGTKGFSLQNFSAFYCVRISTGLAAGSGIFIGTRPRRRKQGLLKHFCLNKRAFKSTTALSPELCFLMSNLARIRDGSIVCDPFCGSCSLLLSAAYIGATRTYGFDIDEETIVPDQVNQNFKMLNLRSPILERRSITSINDSPESKYDAIVTDPPYRMRSKIHLDENGPTENIIEHMIEALVKLSEHGLRQGGYICFIYPQLIASKDDAECGHVKLALQKMTERLTIVDCFKQKFSSTFYRYIIVAIKLF